MDWQQYTKIELRNFRTETFRQGGGSRPDVFLLEKDGQFAVLKDHEGMDDAYARFIGPLLAWREAKALKRLHGLEGVPQLLASPDKRSLLMEYVPARQVVNVDSEEYKAASYLQSLQTLIEEMHKRGIAHGDLRSPTNALIDDNGNAALVDFVASLGRGSSLNFINRYLFEKLCLVDFSAITKLKKRIAPELLNQSDIESQEVAGKKGMAFRKLGQSIRTLSRWLFTKKS